MNNGISRRGFLGAAASALALPYFIPARALGRDGAVAPSNRLAIASIGLGSRGPQHLQELLTTPDVQIVAACDAYRSRAESHAKLINTTYGTQGCLATQDFREIMARPDIDAVIIAAPENWHALMTIEAARNGKDIYCEKALSLTVAEGRAACQAVRRYGRVCQSGTQQRSSRHFRQACELARNGYLGPIRDVWVSVPSGKRTMQLRPGPVPADLNYDMWLGPAPFKPYREDLCCYNWYFLTDYCAGWIQSWGVHHLDIALWGVPELSASTLDVEGTATFVPEGDANVSFGWNVNMRTPSGLQLHFSDDASASKGHGCRFEGTKGWVHVDRGGIRASSPSLLEQIIKPTDEHLYQSKSHMANFVSCIRSRRDPVAPIEACHAATTASLVADIASRANRKMTWDWNKEMFIHDNAANGQLTRVMRRPWNI